jgi:hypothetical protein
MISPHFRREAAIFRPRKSHCPHGETVYSWCGWYIKIKQLLADLKVLPMPLAAFG